MKKKTLREQYNTIISQVNTLNALMFGGGTVNTLRATDCILFFLYDADMFIAEFGFVQNFSHSL